MDCSICKEPIEVTSFGWAEGNDAWPVNDGRCCDTCDMSVVLTARINMMKDERKEVKE